jgi:hypothetical protein
MTDKHFIALNWAEGGRGHMYVCVEKISAYGEVTPPEGRSNGWVMVDGLIFVVVETKAEIIDLITSVSIAHAATASPRAASPS